MHNQFESEALPSQSLTDTLLEDYLDRVCVPLSEDIRAEEQKAIRQELRAHLLLLAAAHEELGASQEEAIQSALRQFGTAEQLGQSLWKVKTSAPIGRRLLSALAIPLTGLVGGLAGVSITYCFEQLYVRLGIFYAASSPPLLYASIFLFGVLTGAIVWQKRLSVRPSGILTGLIGTAIVIASCTCIEPKWWLRLSLQRAGYLSLCFGIFTVAGITIGGLSSLFSKVWRRFLNTTSRPSLS